VQLRFSDNLEIDLFTALNLCLTPIAEAYFAVAFIKQSGLSQIIRPIEDCLKSGGKVEFIVGLDFRTTEPASLSELLNLSQLSNLNYFCFSDPAVDNSPAFHPKLYIIKRADGLFSVAVGSSNLTDGGLRKNVEVNVVFEGAEEEKFVSDALTIYERIRQQDTLFTPDEDYITAYGDLYAQIRSKTQQSLTTEKVKAEIEHLRVRESVLSGPPTQLWLVIEAIKNVPGDSQGFVHLSAIYEYVGMKAKQLRLDWDYTTLNNSIRGRLNENVEGAGGKDIFTRFGGRAGRKGLYKLSPLGEKMTGG